MAATNDQNGASGGSDGAGQRLWWRDEIAETHQSKHVGATVSPPVTIATVHAAEDVAEDAVTLDDSWVELEAEATRRQEAVARGERENIVIYANKSQNLGRLNRRMWYFGVPVLALYTLLVVALQFLSFHHGGGFLWVSIAPLFLVLEFALLYALVARATRRQTAPTVVLSPEGLTLHTLGHDVGLIYWDEIKEIRAYNLIYRYVGIVPRDAKVLSRRLGPKRSLLIRMNDWVMPLYRNKLVRRMVPFIAEVNLPQQNMPVTADELVAQISEYRAKHGVTND